MDLLPSPPSLRPSASLTFNPNPVSCVSPPPPSPTPLHGTRQQSGYALKEGEEGHPVTKGRQRKEHKCCSSFCKSSSCPDWDVIVLPLLLPSLKLRSHLHILLITPFPFSSSLSAANVPLDSLVVRPPHNVDSLILHSLFS